MTGVKLGLVALLALGLAGDLERARELAQSTDAYDRHKAARDAGKIRTPEAAQFLVGLLSDEVPGVAREAMEQLRKVPAEARPVVLKAVGARSPQVRAMVLEASGRYPFAERWPAVQRGLKDQQPEVRSAAAWALLKGTGGAPEAVAALQKLLSKERDVRVRCAALEALAGVDQDAAVAALNACAADKAPALRAARLFAAYTVNRPPLARDAAIAALHDDDWHVRACALHILERCRDLDGAGEALVGALERETGRLKHDAAAVLAKLAKKQMGTDAELWRAWWDARKAKREAGERPAKPKNDTRARPTFYELTVNADRVTFVLDLSGSMRESPGDGLPPRIDTAKAQLQAAIAGLPDTAAVNVIGFGEQIRPFDDRQAPLRSKRAALLKWIRKLRVKGYTNIYDSLMLALEDPGVEAIYLITDGSASRGRYTDNDHILEMIGRANRYRRVQIHTVAVGQTRRGGYLMPKLAERNGGRYCKKD